MARLSEIGEEYQRKRRGDLKWATRDANERRWKRFIKIVGDIDGCDLRPSHK